MRILLLTQYYSPEPLPYLASLATGLRDHGHEVEVLTGHPCYPLGKTYPGYKQRLWSRETMDGIRVTRLPQVPDHSRSAIRRILYYLSFAFAGCILGPFLVRKPDVILVYQSALPTGYCGLFLSTLFRSSLVLDVVDLWPESLRASGMLKNRAVLRVVGAFVKLLYRCATHVCVITEGYRESLRQFGVPEAKISIVYYWSGSAAPKAAPVGQEKAAEASSGQPFTVMYAGNMGACQHLQTVVEAAAILRNEPAIRFVLVGNGTERQQLRDQCHKLNLTNVEFWEPVPPSETPRLYARADALLVHLQPSEMAELSIPSKTFDYLANGKPVLMCASGEAARLVQKHGFGVVAPPCDPVAMAAAVTSLCRSPGETLAAMRHSAQFAYHNEFSAERQVAKLESVLRASAGIPAAPHVPQVRVGIGPAACHQEAGTLP